MKNSMRGFTFFLVMAAACYFVVSCNFKKDYSGEIKRLDSLSVRLDSSMMILEKVSEGSPVADSVMSQLQFIQYNYKSTMPQPMAKILNQYGMMRKDMMTATEFSQTLRSQMDSARIQIVDLRQALQEGATHDSKDNKLTEDYVKRAMQTEEKKVGELLAKAKQSEIESSKLQKVYQALNPQVKMWVDSIAAKELK